MKDLKSQLDLLKRRIERQENEYVQTVKLNTVLRGQVTNLQYKDQQEKFDEAHKDGAKEMIDQTLIFGEL